MLTDALVVEAPGSPFAFRQIIVDEAPRDDEVLVEMTATGLCHTDLNFSKEETIPGLFPAVFGHEGALSPMMFGKHQQTYTTPGSLTCCKALG